MRPGHTMVVQEQEEAADLLVLRDQSPCQCRDRCRMQCRLQCRFQRRIHGQIQCRGAKAALVQNPR